MVEKKGAQNKIAGKQRIGRISPQADAVRKEKGLLQIYTGDGKGKTTAAVGLAVRAVGAGKKVFLIQFLKGRRCGEHRALARLGSAIAVRQYGEARFVRGRPTEADCRAASRGLKAAAQALSSGAWDLVILDEACVAVNLGLFTAAELLLVIRKRSPHVEVVLTGRNACRELIREADLVTDMRAVRHYYHRGVPARAGIEF